jgi:hypothetical protein
MDLIYENKRFLQGIGIFFKDLTQILDLERCGIHLVKRSIKKGSDHPCKRCFPAAWRSVKKSMGKGACVDELSQYGVVTDKV